jgi:formylglycine-generating enzyme required for sulfatase activity
MQPSTHERITTIPETIEIPAGVYRMGQADGRDDEQPLHEVAVSSFRLGRYQVTNGQYDHFCRATGHAAPRFRGQEHFDDPEQPVTGVTWFDAVAYCEWLAETCGPLRLPTEAEWEWAARGGLDGKLYPWGNEPFSERENYAARWRKGPEPVGTSAPNGYGLYDMCENVHEWCSDWYDPEYYSVSPCEKPIGPPTGTRRASRGGAWRHQIKIARCAARSSIPPHLESADYGFRVACGTEHA